MEVSPPGARDFYQVKTLVKGTMVMIDYVDKAQKVIEALDAHFFNIEGSGWIVRSRHEPARGMPGIRLSPVFVSLVELWEWTANNHEAMYRKLT